MPCLTLPCCQHVLSASAQLHFRNSFQISTRSLLAVDFDASDLTLCSFLLATPGSLNCLGILLAIEVIKTVHKAFVQSERFEQALLSTVSGCPPYSVLLACATWQMQTQAQSAQKQDQKLLWFPHSLNTKHFSEQQLLPFFLTQD